MPSLLLVPVFAFVAVLIGSAKMTVLPKTQNHIHYYVRKIGAMQWTYQLEKLDAFQKARDTLLAYVHKREGVATFLDEYSSHDFTVVLTCGIILFSLACAVIAQNVLFIPTGFIVGLFLLCFLSHVVERKNREDLLREVPQVFRLLSGALTSGQTLTQAISYVGKRGKGQVSQAFAHAALEIQCGAQAGVVLDEVTQTIDAPSLKLLSCVLQISQRTGAPLAELLENGAQLVEEQGNLKQLLNTKTAQVRFSAQVVMTLPVLLVGLLALISPDFRTGIFSPIGFASLLVAALLDGIALVAMKRIMASVNL